MTKIATTATTSKRRLEGKLALITGGSRGIGAAVAERFAQEGADLILIGRDIGALEEVDDRVKAHGGQATLVPLDLRNFQKIDELVFSVAERFGKLDILVGNAGVLGTLTPMTDIKPQDWQDVLDINLTANWRLLRGFDPLLKKSPAGRAIFVSSDVAQIVSPYWSTYGVSKAALEMMVKMYAQEIARTHPNLRVNLIDPGGVRTNMYAAAMPGEDPLSVPDPVKIAPIFVDLASNQCRQHGEVIVAIN